jgi:hypothetical protein
MSYKSSIGAIYRALRSQLLGGGVPVGETAEYPRIEIHSFTENAPTDKDGRLRSLSCIVESMSVTGYGEAVAMNARNLERLQEDGWQTFGDFTIIGLKPDQLTELTETTDTQEILYRQLQRIEILIWQS